MKIRPYQFWVLALPVLSAIFDVAGLHAAAAAESADQAWASVTASRRPPSSKAPNPMAKTMVEAMADRQQLALQSRQVAQAAKVFYESYSTDQRAGQAKKLEALAGLQGVTDADQAYESSAIAVAQRYRNDRANSDADRFDVAVAVENLQLNRRLNHPLNARPPTGDLEIVAHNLHAEFGELPKVFEFYCSVARAADMVSAARIANVVVASSAPSETRSEARTILERAKLVGQHLPYVLNSIDGQLIDLAQPQETPTAILVWSAAFNPSALLSVMQFKAMSPNCRWIYVSINSTREQVLAAKDKAPFLGSHCYYPPSSGAPFVEGLKTRLLPYVYIIDRNGRLSGFGPVEELPNLLAVAQR